jgi:hypothetical protein
MGSWSVHCGISGITISAGQEIVLLPIKKVKYQSLAGYLPYIPTCLPVFGIYNDYGGLENIIENNNTKIIEKFFNISIQEFSDIFTEIKTYKRNEYNYILEKINNKNIIDEWDFTFIDKKIYDYLSTSKNKWENYTISILGMDSQILNHNKELSELMLKLGKKLQLYDYGICNNYLENLDEYKEDILKLSNIRDNIYCMSGYFKPNVKYITPQCGEYKQHQKLLKEFSKINKNYIN